VNSLKDECIFLYKSFFNKKPDESFIDNYIRVHNETHLMEFENKGEKHLVKLIEKKNLNVFGIEYWLRKRNKYNILTKKLLVILYISESDGKHITFFKNDIAFLSPWNTIIKTIIKSFTLIIVGAFQIKKNGI